MSAPDRADLDELRRLEAAATPGPWEVCNANEGTDYSPMWMIANDAFHNPPADEDAPWLAVELHTGVKADAEFIAAAINALPGLLDRLEAAEAERDEWKGQVVCIRGQQRDALTRAEKAEAEAAHLQDTVDHYIARATEAETARNRDAGRLGERIAAERRRAEKAEAEALRWKTAWDMADPLLTERDELAAEVASLRERLAKVEALHVRRDNPVYDRDCLEGECDHLADDHFGAIPTPECPKVADAVCAHCADQTEPGEAWEHMIRTDALWPCATVRAALAGGGER